MPFLPTSLKSLLIRGMYALKLLVNNVQECFSGCTNLEHLTLPTIATRELSADFHHWMMVAQHLHVIDTLPKSHGEEDDRRSSLSLELHCRCVL